MATKFNKNNFYLTLYFILHYIHLQSFTVVRIRKSHIYFLNLDLPHRLILKNVQNKKAQIERIVSLNILLFNLNFCLYQYIATVSLLLSYWLFFQRSISHLLWPSCYLSSHPFLLCLQIHWDAFVLSSVAPFLLSTPYKITWYNHCLSPSFCLLSPLHRGPPPLSSTTESDSVFYSRCLP